MAKNEMMEMVFYQKNGQTITDISHEEMQLLSKSNPELLVLLINQALKLQNQSFEEQSIEPSK